MKFKNVSRLLFQKMCLRNVSMAELEGFCFVLNLLKHNRIQLSYAFLCRTVFIVIILLSNMVHSLARKR